MTGYGRGRLEELAFWLRGTGDWNSQGAARESTDQGSENDFEKHNECVGAGPKGKE